MRTETLTRTLYGYEELSAPAQEKARDWYREHMDNPWSQERRDSLDAFCQVFPVRARDWSFDAMSAVIVPQFAGDDDLAALHGRRLLAYLHNRYDNPKVPLPVFSRRRCFQGQAHKRHSCLLREENCCPFTGYHMDEVLLDPLRLVLRQSDNRTYQALLTDCLWAWVKACRDDWARMLEDDAVAETIIANGWEFTSNGVWAGVCYRWPVTA